MNSITAWDHLEDTVDHLADVVEALLTGHEEFLCSLDYNEAEALADVLDAGMHAHTATRLMHRWALTEPDWDAGHSDEQRRWLDRIALNASSFCPTLEA